MQATQLAKMWPWQLQCKSVSHQVRQRAEAFQYVCVTAYEQHAGRGPPCASRRLVVTCILCIGNLSRPVQIQNILSILVLLALKGSNTQVPEWCLCRA